jgi:hypothetical protein
VTRPFHLPQRPMPPADASIGDHKLDFLVF